MHMKANIPSYSIISITDIIKGVLDENARVGFSE